MSKLDFITSILHLPERSLRLIKDNTFILTLPGISHKCPRCNKPTTGIHSYRNQSVKSVFLFNINYSLIYRKHRYFCTHCLKPFFELNNFISRYQRMSKATIASLVNEHGFLMSLTDIARRFNISTTTVQHIFKYIAPDSNNLSSAISIDEFKGNAAPFPDLADTKISYIIKRKR